MQVRWNADSSAREVVIVDTPASGFQVPPPSAEYQRTLSPTAYRRRAPEGSRGATARCHREEPTVRVCQLAPASVLIATTPELVKGPSTVPTA